MPEDGEPPPARGRAPREPAVEVAAVEWAYVDGLASAEISGATIRLVFYVTDVQAGLPRQDRVAVKLVIPAGGAVEAMRLIELALSGGPKDGETTH